MTLGYIAGVFSFPLNPISSRKYQFLQRPYPTICHIRLYNPISKLVQNIGGFFRCRPKRVKALDLFRILSGDSLYLVTSTLAPSKALAYLHTAINAFVLLQNLCRSFSISLSMYSAVNPLLTSTQIARTGWK